MADLTTQLSKFLIDLYAGTLGVQVPIATLAVGDGSGAAPSIARTTVAGDGISFATNLVRVSNNGVDRWAFDSSGANYQFTLAGSQLAFSSAATVYGNSVDLILARAGIGIAKVSHGTATSAAELQVSGGNGGCISSVKALTELTTIAAAATTSTAIQIPANAVVLGVSVRVVTIIPTAATFTVTSATPTKTWNTAAVAVAAGSTDPGTLPGPTYQTTASAIVITPNLTPGAATGQVRVTIFYYTITPPTS